MSELSVVVPVYGNAATLDELHRRVRAGASGWDLQLILVDDASPDDSRRVISELAARDPAVEPLLLRRNVGQHAAVLEGMRRARQPGAPRPRPCCGGGPGAGAPRPSRPGAGPAAAGGG